MFIEFIMPINFISRNVINLLYGLHVVSKSFESGISKLICSNHADADIPLVIPGSRMSPLLCYGPSRFCLPRGLYNKVVTDILPTITFHMPFPDSRSWANLTVFSDTAMNRDFIWLHVSFPVFLWAWAVKLLV